MSWWDSSSEKDPGRAVVRRDAAPRPPVLPHLRHGPTVALGILIAAVSLVNLLWISHDSRPQPEVDPHLYLIKTLEFVDRLEAQGAADLWPSIAGMSLQGRPPVYQLLSVPFLTLFGRSEDAALGVNLLFVALLLCATYGIGRLAGNGWVGLLAALLVTAYPPILRLSRIYRPHAALPACAAVSVWLLLLLLRRRSIWIAWLFGASLGAGLLIHLNFVYLLPAPALVFGLYMLLFQTEPRWPPNLKATPGWLLKKACDPFVLLGLLPALLIALGLTAAWYLPHRQAILTLQREVQAHYDFSRGFATVPTGFWWYARTAPGALSTVLALLVGIGLGISVVRRRLGPSFLAITFLLATTAFGLRAGDMGWLHFAPALPVAAAVTAVGLAELRDLRPAPWARIGRWFSAGAILVCIVVAGFVFATVTWGVGPPSRPIALALGAPLDADTCRWRMHLAFCPDPARDEDWHVADILRTVVNAPECQTGPCRLAVIPGAESLNPTTFDAYLTVLYPQLRDRVQVDNPGQWTGPPDDGDWITSEYLVYAPQMRHWGNGKEIRTECTHFLESPPPVVADLYQEAAAFPLPDGGSVVLLKRTEPLTVDRAIQLYEAAVRGVPSDGALYGKLGSLYLRTGNLSRAEELFRAATQIRPTVGSPYLALGSLYQSQGRIDQAIAAFREAIEQEPFEPKAYRHLADLLQAEGDLPEAIGVYELAVQNNPRLTWPYLELGSVCVRANRLAEARAAYQAALRTDPWNETARANLRALHWSLASNLGAAEAYADGTPLTWWQGEAWVRPYPYEPDVLVGRSGLEAGGRTRPDQMLLHPFGAEQATHLRFQVAGGRYDTLQIGYGLADQVTGLSNGVHLTLRASVDGGESYALLWQKVVTGSEWLSQTLSLSEYRGEDLSLDLAADALGDDSYDWLQTTVRLFPGQ